MKYHFVCPVLSSGVWYVGVDSGRGDRLFSSVCSLLGDVCVHLGLDCDHMPVCNIPHRSAPQDATDPLDYTGITNSIPTVHLLCMSVCMF